MRERTLTEQEAGDGDLVAALLATSSIRPVTSPAVDFPVLTRFAAAGEPGPSNQQDWFEVQPAHLR